MCGRYVRRSDKQRIAGHFHVYGPSVPDFAPSWNVAPQTFQPIIRLDRDTREREIVIIRWDPIPYYILLTNSEAAPEVSENRTLQVLSEKPVLQTRGGSLINVHDQGQLNE
jgi:putative SOS response-associated peptidase YedK